MATTDESPSAARSGFQGFIKKAQRRQGLGPNPTTMLSTMLPSAEDALVAGHPEVSVYIDAAALVVYLMRAWCVGSSGCEDVWNICEAN